MVNFRAEAGKSGESQRETEEGENLEYSLLKVSRIHLRSIQKKILVYFVARVCGHPCLWSLLGLARQIRPAGSPGRGVSPTGLTSSQSCSPRPTREASLGSVETRALPPKASRSVPRLRGLHLLEIQIHTLLTRPKDLLPLLECILGGKE